MTPHRSTLDTLQLHQANERTLLAWIRTGIAMMGFGFAIARFGLFLRELEPLQPVPQRISHGSGWQGALLVGLGAGINLLATARYRTTKRAIDNADYPAPSSAAPLWVGALATILGTLMLALLLRTM
jgi:putative membrane protein